MNPTQPSPPIYQSAPGATTPARRPATVVIGVLCVALSGIAGIAFLALVLANGRAMLNGIVNDIIHKELGSGSGSGLAQAALDDAYSTLTTRAYVLTFGAVFLLILALLAWSGRNWTRFVMIPFLLIAVGMWARDLTDTSPAPLHALDVAGIVLGVLGIVILLLPPSGRFGKARKAARRNRKNLQLRQPGPEELRT